MSQLVRARLIKMVTDDGLLPLVDDVHVGDVFLVDLDTKQTALMLNRAYNIQHEKDIVQCAENGYWIPLECVELFL